MDVEPDAVRPEMLPVLAMSSSAHMNERVLADETLEVIDPVALIVMVLPKCSMTKPISLPVSEVVRVGNDGDAVPFWNEVTAEALIGVPPGLE